MWPDAYVAAKTANCKNKGGIFGSGLTVTIRTRRCQPEARPIVSAAMVAKAATVTPRAALNLVAELGIREETGRGRYRAWGII